MQYSIDTRIQNLRDEDGESLDASVGEPFGRVNSRDGAPHISIDSIATR